MPLVLVGISSTNEKDRVSPCLRQHGFSVVALPRSGILPTIEATGLGGGRLDAVVLPDLADLTIGHAAFNDWLGILKAIRTLDARLTFRGGVRARAIPVIFGATDSADFVETEHLNQFGRFARRPFGDANACKQIIDAVTSGISEWRQRLLRELEYVGYSVTQDALGRTQVSHVLQRKRREGELLADEATPGALRASQYLILAEDFIESYGRYDKLKFLIDNYERIAANEGIKPETVFQRFFEENSDLLKRNAFEQLWAKPVLRLPEDPKRSYQPDFVLRPRIAATVGTQWEILDLKLPDDPVVTSGAFHTAFSAKLTRAVQQLRNYREYFSRVDTRDQLIERFGFQPVHPRVAVLIGRRNRTDGLEKAQGSAALDVSIITYDDIVEFEESRLFLQGHFAGIFAK
jgi:hypothetical protein